MIRFKLRTLLLVTAIIAAVVGFYGHRISTLTRGSRAYEQLAKRWVVEIHQTPYGWKETDYPQKSNFQKFIDWPVRKLLENDRNTTAWDLTDNNTYSMWLFDEAGKNKKSLEGLEHFHNITELKIDSAIDSAIEIDDDEFSRIAKLKNLNAENPAIRNVIERTG